MRQCWKRATLGGYDGHSDPDGRMADPCGAYRGAGDGIVREAGDQAAIAGEHRDCGDHAAGRRGARPLSVRAAGLAGDRAGADRGRGDYGVDRGMAAGAGAEDAVGHDLRAPSARDDRRAGVHADVYDGPADLGCLVSCAIVPI